MFDTLPSRASLARAGDAAVVDAIEAFARAEAAAAAGRLAAIAELMGRRLLDEDERQWWVCDCWDSAAAEVAAALGISHRRASSQLHLARALRDRLPRIEQLLTAGLISARMVATIAWRTHLVDEPVAMAAIDAALAERAGSWGPLSDARVELAVDAVLEAHDPDAKRAFEVAARGRDVAFGKPDDATGTASVFGRLYNTDATLIARRLTELTRQLCGNDPRSAGERRADALGAMAAETGSLACRCGSPVCAGAQARPASSPVVVHVIADQGAVGAAQLARTPSSTAADRRPFSAAVLQGGGVIPTPLLAELLANGATVVPLRPPSETAEPRYRPSAALARFVRARDLTCRFPGCDAAADYCDIDHTIAYPVGVTHPSGLACLCRKHHLLKTFWIGQGGWSDVQRPDGTIEWTSPSGKTYTTYPGSRLISPGWDTSTAPLAAPNAAQILRPGRGLLMPKRRRTRRAEHAQRIKNLRAQRDTS